MDRAGYRPRGGSGWGLSYPSQEEVAGDVRPGCGDPAGRRPEETDTYCRCGDQHGQRIRSQYLQV